MVIKTCAAVGGFAAMLLAWAVCWPAMAQDAPGNSGQVITVGWPGAWVAPSAAAVGAPGVYVYGPRRPLRWYRYGYMPAVPAVPAAVMVAPPVMVPRVMVTPRVMVPRVRAPGPFFSYPYGPYGPWAIPVPGYIRIEAGPNGYMYQQGNISTAPVPQPPPAPAQPRTPTNARPQMPTPADPSTRPQQPTLAPGPLLQPAEPVPAPKPEPAAKQF